MSLQVHAGQERITLSDGGAPSLELVLCPASNHAYAIHHWAPPAWQRDAAGAVLRSWEIAGPEHSAVASEAEVLLASLRPALLQPLLHMHSAQQRAAAAAATEECAAASKGEANGVQLPASAASPPRPCSLAMRRRERLMLLCTDPAQPAHVAASVCRLLGGPDGADARGHDAEGAREDAVLAARVLAQPLATPLSSLPPPGEARRCTAR